jgi:DNA-binding transcriptional MocR family regulator
VDGSGERTLRLSFSSLPAGKIDEGVRRLGELVRTARKRPSAQPIERVAAPLV